MGNNQAKELFLLTILAKQITFLHIWHWVQMTFDYCLVIRLLDSVSHRILQLLHQGPGQGNLLLLDDSDQVGQRGQLVVFLQFAL